MYRTGLFCCLSLALILGCATVGELKPAAAPEPAGDVPDAVNRFALDFHARVRDREGNLFYSPYSLSTALAMTWAGADGRTAEQMAAVLHLADEREAVHAGYRDLTQLVNQAGQTEGVRIEVANALWGQQDYEFLQAFLQTLETHYNAGLERVDFARETEAARQRINRWVEEATDDLITDLLPEGTLSALTRLVLTNAIYFKGLWESPFDEEQTRDAPFFPEPDRSVEVPMMHQKARFGYAETADCLLLDMPYEGEELSMLVALPPEDSSLADLEARLTAERLQEWTEALRPREVNVFIPRFKVESTFSLAEELRGMGMGDAFDPRAADFSGMSVEDDDLHISDVVHKAYVEVNEEGTEAAAATGVVVGITAVTDPPPVFLADRPFLFLIRHRPTGVILFLGRVTDPTAGR